MATPTDRADTTPDPQDNADDPPTFEQAQEALFDAYGLDVTSRFVDLETPGVRTHVFETGEPDDDVPLLFVHPTAAYGAFFTPLLAHLESGRAIVYDRPGHGRSERFVYTRSNVIGTAIASIRGVLDALDLDRVDLVGHSMGGLSGIRFALAESDRVRRLILVGAVPGFPGTRPPVPIRLLSTPVLKRVIHRLQKSGEAGVLDVAEIFGEREAIQDHPPFIRALVVNDRTMRLGEGGFSEYDALISLRGFRSSARLRESDLRTLEQPTTVLWGTHDPLGDPAAVRAGLEAIPDVRVETLDAGHIPYLAHPGRCAAVIQEARNQS